MKRRNTTPEMKSLRERQRSRVRGYDQNEGGNRQSRRQTMAEGRKELTGRGRVLDALNDKRSDGFMHPTKGNRTIQYRRALAANIAAEIAAGNHRLDLKLIKSQLIEAG